LSRPNFKHGPARVVTISFPPDDEAALQRLIDAADSVPEGASADSIVEIRASDVEAVVAMLMAITGTFSNFTAHGRSQLLVCAERVRQVDDEGFSAERDDQYVRGELALAAACYAAHAVGGGGAIASVQSLWPFPRAWWKPGTPARDLTKAAALLIAELDRRERAAGGRTSH